ncbi:MAG TPA: CHAD domain-containing protein [Candidatus Acidoferrales bacterium]|nr:CHAD domain-containing protein [Candidatus Acidoferrales bacterium]
MERVLERAERVQPAWDAADVHALRVAIRRCRTMADALSEVNPGPGWRKLKKSTRELFRALGKLRDTQMERALVKRLGPPGDPLRKHMLRLLSREQQRYRESAEQALIRFDRKEWKKLSRRLASKARFFPLGSVVFQRLALARLNRAADLYRKARKQRSSVAWHRLRVGLKRFRYVAENFMPQRYEAWADDLKRMQDLLGEVHDLDVLRADLRRRVTDVDAAIVAQWFERIDRERKARLREFTEKCAGPESPWLTWRAGFPWGPALAASSLDERRTA